MSKRPNISQSIALRAAAAIAADEDQEPSKAQVETAGDPELKNRGGRPKGKRDVAARHTVYLDAARHDALTRMAEDRGRSVHSLIIEGIDHVVGKPVKAMWHND